MSLETEDFAGKLCPGQCPVFLGGPWLKVRVTSQQSLTLSASLTARKAYNTVPFSLIDVGRVSSA
eukprot:scaffold73406_cov19-Tisochrysis_lutea.AAC.2